MQAAILKSLKELAAGRTCVFVAHRLYVKYAFITSANCIAFAVLTPLCYYKYSLVPTGFAFELVSVNQYLGF